jgi:hypothetical protein
MVRQGWGEEMRALTKEELSAVAGGAININKQITVVKAVNSKVVVKQKVVQRNGQQIYPPT